MAKKVYVTKAQSRAAGAIVQRSAVTGRIVRPGVAKIAAADLHHHESVVGQTIGNSNSRSTNKTEVAGKSVGSNTAGSKS